MAGSVFGDIFTCSTWGESHGKALGVVVDGCPAGLSLSEEDFSPAMKRRSPGQTIYSTPRSEADEVEILSGVFEGRTTGTPISLMIRNTSQRSQDYSEVAGYYRPGHADFCFDAKYGFRDYRGGGRSSGRETAARVAAGVIAEKLLGELGIHTRAYVSQVGPHICKNNIYDGTKESIPSLEQVEKSPLRMPDLEVSKSAEQYLSELMSEGDSSGGMIECVVTGVPAGIGDPVNKKLDAMLSQALFSIGAVKGVEIGDGFKVASLVGSENNDSFIPSKDGIKKATNHAGGILGGISDGSDIVLRVAFKPTPSISKEQKTVNTSGEAVDVSVKGRHDPIIVPRAVVVVEAMVNLVLADRLLAGMGARIDKVKEFYKS